MMPTEAETTPTTPPTDPSARRLKVRRVKLTELVEDVGNPRRHDERDLAATEASLKAHGQVDPLVVQKGTMRLIAGHGRKEAMRRLGWDRAEIVEVECDDVEFRALSIRLNRTGELAGWDFALLETELAMLADAGWGNLGDFGWDEAALDALAGGTAGGIDSAGSGDEGASEGVAEPEQRYTRKIKAPIYEIRGEKPGVGELFDNAKTRSLVAEIDAAGLPAEVADFLRLAATRHTIFEFRQIAEFYAHSSADVQSLMERSALVIIDFDKAIENGFVKMTDDLIGLVGEEPKVDDS